ncbi:molybdopterin molybdenumtransferase MoeA, partial [bacterium]|nr:molybdopterin molybdenumtransferase MoeA [bacterium]
MSLISPSEAEQFILDHASLLELESISLENSLGRILRKDLHADRPFPPFDRVTMDGITFRHTDYTGAPLKLQGLHPAGSPDPESLKPGHCWQIMTGASLPPDCDTVVPYEEVEINEDSATINCEPTEG